MATKKNDTGQVILTKEVMQRMTPEERKRKLDELNREIDERLKMEIRYQAFNDYPTYAKEYIKITDKKAEQVALIHNSIQKRINDKIAELRKQNRLVRIIILKPRQCGVSTDTQGRMLYNTATKENRTGLIVAHTQPATTIIFEKARYMFNNLPEDVKPLLQASNARELVFDKPTGYKGKGKGLHSKISIQVAGDVNIGRGDTIHYVHLSEFAFFPSPEGKDPKKQLAGILQAVPKTLDTEVILESTANGYNAFKDIWDEAVSGESEWTPLFFPWHDNPEARMSSTEQEKTAWEVYKKHHG